MVVVASLVIWAAQRQGESPIGQPVELPYPWGVDELQHGVLAVPVHEVGSFPFLLPISIVPLTSHPAPAWSANVSTARTPMWRASDATANPNTGGRTPAYASSSNDGSKTVNPYADGSRTLHGASSSARTPAWNPTATASSYSSLAPDIGSRTPGYEPTTYRTPGASGGQNYPTPTAHKGAYDAPTPGKDFTNAPTPGAHPTNAGGYAGPGATPAALGGAPTPKFSGDAPTPYSGQPETPGAAQNDGPRYEENDSD